MTKTPDGSSPSTSPDTSPSQNPTASDGSGGSASQLDFYGLAVAAFVMSAVVALFAVGVVLVRRRTR